MAVEALKLIPATKDYIWGGTKLKEEYNIKSNLETVAEAWVLSAHKAGESIVENGSLKGKTLSEAINALGEDVLGKNAKKFPYFPILIKLINAKDNLSVQVHPNDEFALKHENEFGKTEMWYILEAEENAFIYYGFKKDVTKEEFKTAIKNNTLCDILNKVYVKKGECFFIESGTIHAICKGITVAEIQQNSNTTYRVYDYGRRDKNGNLRELHIDKALEVTNLKALKNKDFLPKGNVLCDCKYFKCEKQDINGSFNAYANEDSFLSILVLEGEISFLNVTLKKGESAFIPANTGEFEIKGNASIIESRI